MARPLRGNFLHPGVRRLFGSEPVESQFSAYVFAVSVVFREDDLRSLAGHHFFPACPDERGCVWLTRAHLGIPGIGLPQTDIHLMVWRKSGLSFSVSSWERLIRPVFICICYSSSSQCCASARPGPTELHGL